MKAQVNFDSLGGGAPLPDGTKCLYNGNAITFTNGGSYSLAASSWICFFIKDFSHVSFPSTYGMVIAAFNSDFTKSLATDMDDIQTRDLSDYDYVCMVRSGGAITIVPTFS